MVSAKTVVKRIFGSTEKLIADFEKKYQNQKDEECETLYNDIIEVMAEHKASIQNVLFVIKMIEWGYLRAKYLQLVEGTVVVPEGNIPLPKDKKK